jgi:hypothetical protein
MHAAMQVGQLGEENMCTYVPTEYGNVGCGVFNSKECIEF